MEPEEKSHGALMGVIIIVIILILGGVYLVYQSIKEREAAMETQTTETQQEEPLDLDGTSTTTVETEIEMMDFENLDSEI